jgi:hypothetical protein
MRSNYEFVDAEIKRTLRQCITFGVQVAKVKKRIIARLGKKSLKVEGLDVVRSEDGSLRATGLLILNGAAHTLDVSHRPPREAELRSRG